MRPLVATVDLAAIRHNYAQAKRCAPGRRALAVVKADAYGHGAAMVATALAEEADGFAVCCVEEARVVRANAPKARILLLEGCFDEEDWRTAVALNLDVAVQGTEQAERLLMLRSDRQLNVWLKLDSGMHRLGFSAEEIRHWAERLRAAPQVAEVNLISHLACADERGHELTGQQLDCYVDLQDVAFDQRSFANSAAVLTFAPAHMDWVRPGIMLYGASPFTGMSAAELGLTPAMSLTAQIIALHDVPAGEGVGYGAAWVAQRPSRIATVSCGYADGYPRHAPSGTPVVVRGRRVPLAGRVSMDMLAIDVTDLPEARIGDAVELWGAQLSVDEVAKAAGTIGYELLTKVTARVRREYRS
ncbi:alanine racemase [Pseudomonas flexibilis]|uniref:Alanine racemase n=1 Tax=Pseudomonas flexibilis TaxID=706570 RepID=A0A1N6N2P7_9PSED|nr:alanine racemase [Pseudomonas flexibilis]KHL70741.1 alanine racemase [Pseudomonas flexibilis]SIP86354.1 alanine racemase [Pseudomonas flexibilis]